MDKTSNYQKTTHSLQGKDPGNMLGQNGAGRILFSLLTEDAERKK